MRSFMRLRQVFHRIRALSRLRGEVCHANYLLGLIACCIHFNDVGVVEVVHTDEVTMWIGRERCTLTEEG